MTFQVECKKLCNMVIDRRTDGANGIASIWCLQSDYCLIDKKKRGGCGCSPLWGKKCYSRLVEWDLEGFSKRTRGPPCFQSDTAQQWKHWQGEIPEDYAWQPVHKNNSVSGGVGSSQGEKVQFCSVPPVSSGTYRTEEGNYRSFEKVSQNDLHPFGKGTVLRSKLRRESDGIKSVKTEF